MKAKFLSPLFIKLTSDKDSGKYELTEPLTFFSEILGEITVPTGFRTDFASVPRLPLAYLLAGDTAHRPAVVHDFLYACSDVPRGKADAVFLEAMEAIGVPWWRRRLMWSAVRSFGWTVRKKTRTLVPA